ncbi:MAG TPA: alpha-amylase family glycosyl hydrolase, partial [Polyangiaceae bacterium]|nr:alpha-amylase family glycosyl hydrolase [Polyangiaceae bacterium]
MKVIVDIVTNHLGQVFYYDINNNGQPDVSVSGSGTALQGSSDSATLSGVSVVSEYDPDYDPRGIQAFSSLGQSGPAITRFFDMPEIYRVPPMPEIFQRPESYHRRGRVTNWNDPNQVQFGDFPGGLKDLDTENPDVVQALTDAYVEWILKTDIDGFRIDTIKHVGMDFWRSFAPAVRQRLAAQGKTNFLMFGEAFDGDDALVGSYTSQDQFDSVVYFPQTFQVFDGVFMNSGATSAIQTLYDERATNYSSDPQPGGVGIPPNELLVNFIDNHDVPRFLWQGGNVGALHAALAYLFTEQGLPCLYYGTEQRFHGGNDPNNREPLWWSGYSTTGETFQLISKLIRTRKTYAALRRGGFDLKWTTDHTGAESDAGIVAFERKTPDGDYALVVINAQGKQASETSTLASGGSSMLVTAPPSAQLVDALSGNPVSVAADGTLDVQIQPDSVAVFVPAGSYVP